MNQVDNVFITQLSGYLKCLSRLCGNDSYFGVSAYEAECELDDLILNILNQWGAGDEFITPSEYLYSGRELIEPKVLFKEIESYVFNGLLNSSNMPDNDTRVNFSDTLIRDINEFYGLVSTTENEQGDFHPLYKGEVYRLNISNPKYVKSFFFIKKIEDLYVLTYFIQWAK